MAVPSAGAENVPRCPAVEIVVVAGSFESTSEDSPHDIRGFIHGVNFARELQAAYPGEVTAWQVPYPSTVTLLGSSLGVRDEQRVETYLPYGASSAEGVRNAQKHMERQSQRCPSTKYLVAGYSQGASVAGDLVESVGRGEVSRVEPADVIGTYLLADPGRSALVGGSHDLYGGVRGLTSATGEVLVPLDQGLPPATYVGATGPRRAGAFDPFNGTVMSLCGAKDPACSMAPNRLPQRVSEAMNEWVDAPDHRAAANEGLKDPKVIGVLLLIGLPVILLLLFGLVSPVAKLVDLAAGVTGLNAQQQASLRALAHELALIGDVTKDFHDEQSSRAGRAVDPVVREVDKLSTDAGSSEAGRLSSVGVSTLVKGPNHIKYFSAPGGQGSARKEKTYTINGTAVDAWIRDDMEARIKDVLAEKSAAAEAATPVAARPSPAEPSQ